MTKNQLPEGVGKKIVEALKRQAEADITLLDEGNNNISSSVPLTDIENLPDVETVVTDEKMASFDNDTIVEEEDLSSILPQGVYKEKAVEEVEQTIEEVEEQPTSQMVFKTEQEKIEVPTSQKEEILSSFFNETVEIPSNILVLKRLISTLPVGVTKQTGAQIIRQTLDAMGLPIQNVLKEAQEVQEELNSSTRSCMLKIQEYKTNILQLEKSVQDYQKNISQINELVSLFLLTDKK